mmetsp:Transcript_3032/g.6084  ORF Transcript_3032/g.6084 Transcript_3032/m.6084 type:complete len:228 (+) Transcript_3032:101-784(+)
MCSVRSKPGEGVYYQSPHSENRTEVEAGACPRPSVFVIIPEGVSALLGPPVRTLRSSRAPESRDRKPGLAPSQLFARRFGSPSALSQAKLSRLRVSPEDHALQLRPRSRGPPWRRRTESPLVASTPCTFAAPSPPQSPPPAQPISQVEEFPPIVSLPPPPLCLGSSLPAPFLLFACLQDSTRRRGQSRLRTGRRRAHRAPLQAKTGRCWSRLACLWQSSQGGKMGRR